MSGNVITAMNTSFCWFKSSCSSFSFNAISFWYSSRISFSFLSCCWTNGTLDIISHLHFQNNLHLGCFCSRKALLEVNSTREKILVTWGWVTYMITYVMSFIFELFVHLVVEFLDFHLVSFYLPGSKVVYSVSNQRRVCTKEGREKGWLIR
jgi:hypothetical protein